jgi:hypothetical protein
LRLPVEVDRKTAAAIEQEPVVLAVGFPPQCSRLDLRGRGLARRRGRCYGFAYCLWLVVFLAPRFRSPRGLRFRPSRARRPED